MKSKTIRNLAFLAILAVPYSSYAAARKFRFKNESGTTVRVTMFSRGKTKACTDVTATAKINSGERGKITSKCCFKEIKIEDLKNKYQTEHINLEKKQCNHRKAAEIYLVDKQGKTIFAIDW